MHFNDILKLIEEKDPLGWETLFTLYGQKFYGFAVINWNFTEDEAWDIVHQTLETVVLKIGEYEISSQAHFDNLLFKIFANFLRQHFRKKKRIEKDFKVIPLLELGNLEDFERNDFNDIENQFSEDFLKDFYEMEEVENPRLRELELALNKLSSLEKELLLLRANNFTYDQIAEMLNIDNDQLKVKHHRAKLKLLKLIQTIKL